jgi:putative ABC transport system permease protein
MRRYPRALRERYGRQMVWVFDELLTDAERGGWPGLARLWLRVGRDLLRPLPGPVGPRAGPRSGRPAPFVGMAGAARSLRRSPGFSALVVAVLGVAMGVNVIVLAVLDAYLLRPLPFPEPHRLVEVRPTYDAVDSNTSEDVFERAVAWNLDGFTLVGDGNPEVVLGAWVTADFFDVFGVHPTLGRVFEHGEGGVGGPSVALISHALWMRRFGGDPGVLGRTIRAFPGDSREDEASFTVVGVLPREFWYLNGYTDVLAPLRSGGPVRIARLRADVPPARAQEILTDRVRQARSGGSAQAAVGVRPLGEAYGARVRPRLVALQSAALLVLLVGCANAGLLLLVRGAGRTREMAVRSALGGARIRLAAHVMWEGLLLTFASGVLGAGLAGGALSTLGGTVQAQLGQGVPGGASALHLDPSVMAILVACCLGLGLVLGSVPLWTTAWGRSGDLVRAGGRTATEGKAARRARGLLVGLEVALSLTLLTGAGLLVRSALHLEAMSLGFDPSGLSAYTVGLTAEAGEGEARTVDFFRGWEADVAALPGVASAGLVRGAPFDAELTAREIEAEGGSGRGRLEAVPQIASPPYFHALGLAPVQGRAFDEEDGPGRRRVAVVSASLASALWPDATAVGRKLRFTAWTMPEMEDAVGPWLEVVGVVPDVVDGMEEARPTVYVPFRQAASPWMTLVVRNRPGAEDLSGQLRRILQLHHAGTPVYSEVDLSAAVARARAPSRFFAALLGLFSAFSVVLSVLGLYGVAAYAAHRRRRDVAVRMALGADSWRIERTFLRQGSGTVAAGLVVGLVGGRALAHGLREQLHGVSPGDMGTGLILAALLGFTALVALWLPARRAVRSDLTELLREE